MDTDARTKQNLVMPGSLAVGDSLCDHISVPKFLTDVQRKWQQKGNTPGIVVLNREAVVACAEMETHVSGTRNSDFINGL